MHDPYRPRGAAATITRYRGAEPPMTALAFPLVPGAAAGFLAELARREPTLARFGFLLWAAMVPVAIALAIDERTLRDANVWWKPLKFLLSVGAFSLTTAWFVGLLPEARRRARPVRLVVATVVAAGGFEIGYIVLQAALGEASHYNVGDALHGTLYTLMAIAAIALVATQGVLAVELGRHAALGDGAWRTSVIAGLALTFVLGIASGMPLGGLQPPSGGGLPVLGWHLAGDLRPAHFLGIHAHHLLPLAGFALDRIAPARGRAAAVALVCAYVAGFAGLMVLGLAPARG
jgi:hypothetical protein